MTIGRKYDKYLKKKYMDMPCLSFEKNEIVSYFIIVQ